MLNSIMSFMSVCTELILYLPIILNAKHASISNDMKTVCISTKYMTTIEYECRVDTHQQSYIIHGVTIITVHLCIASTTHKTMNTV